MNNQLSKKEIVKLLGENKSIFEKQFGVKKIGLFGSYARNENNPESDIDLFVDLERHTLHDSAGLLIYLENIFGRKVELVIKHKNIKQRFLHNIEKDIYYV